MKRLEGFEVNDLDIVEYIQVATQNFQWHLLLDGECL
jgi:hypothetical protein